jgi:pectinesterase
MTKRWWLPRGADRRQGRAHSHLNEERKMLKTEVLPRLALAGVTLTLLLALPLCLAPVAPAYAQGSRYVDNNPTRQCGGNTPCYATIQAAVDAANSGETIYVYPGTYSESVDLSSMSPQGDLTLVTVNSAGVPTPGTVEVHYEGPEAEIRTATAFDGDVTIDGFVVYSDGSGMDVELEGAGGADRNLVIRNVTATGTGNNGIEAEADGDVTVTNCTANDNVSAGGSGMIVKDTGGDVTILDCEASGNGSTGIRVNNVDGAVTVRNCTASGNQARGVWVSSVDGVMTISNCTADGNTYGFTASGLSGALNIESCVARGNEVGVWFNELSEADEVLVNGSIICDNSSYGLEADSTASIDAEGNWWGCADGPNDPGGACDAVDPGPPTVDFTPWVSRLTSSATSGPVRAWEPTVVSFQFSGGPPAVYLGQGPGDLRGPAPFTVSTDNGTLNGNGPSVGAFVNGPGGVLTVTLEPHHAGTATVVLEGPCGLEDSAVLAVDAEFVPEAETLLFLGSGLIGLAGYAGLRLRKR